MMKMTIGILGPMTYLSFDWQVENIYLEPI